MKARFYALMALVLGLASCQTDMIDGIKVDANGEAPVTIQVGLPLEAATRAAGNNSGIGAIGNLDLKNDWDIRYILEVYDANGTLAKERMVNRESENTSTSFALRLVPGRDYKFVVWADFIPQSQEGNGDYHYNTSSLAKVTLSDDSYQHPMDESRDAYTEAVVITKFDAKSTVDLTLTRPFAKMRVVTTDMNELYSKLTYVTVHYTTDIYTAFDAINEKVVEDSLAEVCKAANYRNQDFIYADEANSKDGKMTLYADYFFGAKDGKIHFTMDVEDETGFEIPQAVFNTDIPVQRNFLTTIQGPILTDPNDITVTIDSAFETPNIDVEIISGVKTETLKLSEGTYLFGDVTFNVENGAAIEVEGDVVMDVMGVVKINAVKGIEVKKNASLTINGVVDTRSVGRAGHLVVNASNGSAIGGNDITINNLAGLTAMADGDHAFGIGGADAEVAINNTKIDYVCGGHVQALFVNDTKYGKSEPEGGAAIGGAKVTLERVEIVKAEGGSKAAAIGNSYWQSTEVVIKNSELGDIFGGNASAAIGGSRYANESKHNIKIQIENTTVTNAIGGEAGAGVGSGYDTHCNQENYTANNEINIIKSNITAKGGKYAAGIGTGYHSAYLTGSIDAESTINATSGETWYKDAYTTAQNIGYGIIDPAREGVNLEVTFTVAGQTINIPGVPVVVDGATVEGIVKDIVEGGYNVSSAEGFNYIAEQVNAGNRDVMDKNISLDGDIDLSAFALTRSASNWTPIGTFENPFTGDFDGKGYTIKNLTIVNPELDSDGYAYAGFFGVTESNTIKNLTIENVTINTTGHIVAAAIAYPYYTTLENIKVKGNVSIKGGDYTAGVLAYTRRCENAKNIAIEANNGSIVGNNTVGGVISDIQMNGGLTANYSNFKASGLTINGNKCVGGISGIISKQTLNGAEVKNVTIVCDDVRKGKIAGSVGEPAVINNVVVENVAGAGNFVGATYDAGESSKVTVNGVVYEYNADGTISFDGKTCVSTADELVAALAAGEGVFFMNDITVAATKGGYNKAGILQNKAQTIDGNGHTLTVTGAGATWDCAIYTNGGTIKNLTVAGAMRGIFTAGQSADLHIENVVFKNVIYTFNSDGTMPANPFGVYVSDSNVNGWTSHSNMHTEVVYTNCSFGVGSGYKYCRPYGKTSFVNCTFCAGYTIDESQTTEITYTNCTWEE